VTRSQIEQLKLDNIVVGSMPSLYGERHMTLAGFMDRFGSMEDKELKKVDEILPSYL